MGRFQVGWQLGLRSWRLLRTDKELVVLPLLSIVSVVLLVLVLGLPAAVLQRHAGHLTFPTAFLIGVLLVLANFAATFFGAAVVAGALERLDGGSPTLRSAVSAAWSRKGAIFGWALLSTVVSLVINLVEERLGALGRVAGWFLDVAWAVATAFALPVIVVEGTGPIASLQRSASIVKERWGQAAGTYAGASIVFLPAWLLTIALTVVLVAVSPALGITVGIALVLVIGVLSACVSGIARAALYQYATSGRSPLLDPGLAQAAFRPRRRRGGIGGSGGGPGGFSGGGF